MEKCIYSKRYFSERIDTGIPHPALTMYRRPETILTNEAFIEFAIEFSKTSNIGLDLFEHTDRLYAVFFLHTEIIPKEKSVLWDKLMAASHLMGLTIHDTGMQTLVAHFIRFKEPPPDEQ